MLSEKKTFKKEQRLLKRSSYITLFQKKKTFSIRNEDGGKVVLDWAFSYDKRPKIGITVTKKQGGSVERNYFKRLVREAFRISSFSKQSFGIHINVRVRGALLEKKGDAFCFTVQLTMIEKLFSEFESYIFSIQKRV